MAVESSASTWSQRFEQGLHPAIERFNASIGFDIALLQQEMRRLEIRTAPTLEVVRERGREIASTEGKQQRGDEDQELDEAVQRPPRPQVDKLQREHRQEDCGELQDRALQNA